MAEERVSNREELSPDEQRCHKSNGNGWRCKNIRSSAHSPSMFCDHHYSARWYVERAKKQRRKHGRPSYHPSIAEISMRSDKLAQRKDKYVEMNRKPKKKKTNRSIDDPNPTAHAVFENDDIVCDILSRLPAKSVLQAKSVCKNWRSLIRHPHFIDLHFERSKARPRLFFVSQSEHYRKKIGIRYEGFNRRVCFSTTDLEIGTNDSSVPNSLPIKKRKRKIGTRSSMDSAIHTLTEETLFCYDEILVVNGLICFVNYFKRTACIYNISTREVTPWMKSVFAEELEGWDRDVIFDSGFVFGFDPVMKDYKVIYHSRFSQKGEDGTYKRIEVWEVLKLGDNAWRRIEEAPTLRLGSAPVHMHVNGTIYWFPSKDASNFGLYLLSFDVGTEKFRIIPIPKSIADQIFNSHEAFDYRVQLLQVDGCVTVLCRMRAYDFKLFIFHDNFKETSEACDRNWIEDTLNLKCTGSCYPLTLVHYLFYTVVGTDNIMLEIDRNKYGKAKNDDVYLYSCNLKNKTFNEMNIMGFPSSIPFDDSFASLGVPYTENLLPMHTFNQPRGA